jgi:putative ABC transport system permease protein
VVSRLHLKLVRDVRSAFWQFAAISIVASLGVAVFHGLLMAYENQKQSYAISYGRLRFAHVTVPMKRAPRAVLGQLGRLPGARAVEGRIVVDVEVKQDSGRRPRVTGRLVSIPAGRESRVNLVHVREGRLLGSGFEREALLEASFADRHRYHPGDSIYPVLSGHKVRFRVVGIVASAEYIYAVQSKQFLMPTPETFGVLFVPQQQIETLLGMAGSINEAAFLTAPGQELTVGKLAFGRLKAYGAQEPITQKQQPSNMLLQSDLDGYRPMAVVMPILFLGTAALAVSTVLARWVQAQRGQIGFLRASGFPARALLFHYVQLGLIAGVGGGLVGMALGQLFGVWISAIYAEFLRMPFQIVEPQPQVAAAGFCLSLFACSVGALGPARQAAALAPAEAMRGQIPAAPRFAARFRLPLMAALPLRNLLRRPLRTFGTAAGVGSATMLLVLSAGLIDSMTHSMQTYLNDIQRYDLLVGFSAPRSQAIIGHLARWPGVRRAEPSLELPIRARHGDRDEETVAIGIIPGARLRRLPGPDSLPMFPLPGGGLFSTSLARKLLVEPGAWLHLAFTQNTKEAHARLDVRSGPTIVQPVGTPVYVPMRDLQRRFAAQLGMPPDAVTGALLSIEPAFLSGIRHRLNRMEGMSTVQTKAELEKLIWDLTGYSKAFMNLFMLFGLAMAFAVTFTATDSVLWERTRELATLRTLGFGMGRIALLVSIENLVMAAFGALGGLMPGRWIAEGLMNASQTEGFTMQIHIEPATYVAAAAGPLTLVLLAQWPGLRRIRKLDLAAAIRLRDE